VKYLKLEEVLVIHARIIDATGGKHGVHDIHLLLSITERPKATFDGKQLYPKVFDKAAAYLHSTAMNHAFSDGNKRTAIAIAARFLYINDYILSTSNKILEEFVIRVVVKKLKVEVIAKWIEKHSIEV